MQLLNLDPKQTVVIKRPASEFPEPADAYLCDKCGRDITPHLYRGRAHVRQPLGPVRYVCRCGQAYLSGTTEWDYLSDWEKRQWLMDIPLMFILFALVAAYATVAYFAVVHRSHVAETNSIAARILGRISGHLAESFYSGSGISLVSGPVLRKLDSSFCIKGKLPPWLQPIEAESIARHSASSHDSLLIVRWHSSSMTVALRNGTWSAG